MKITFKFFTYLFVATFALALWIYVTTPNAKDAMGCVTTKMYKVQLCDKSSNYVKLSKISPLLKNLILIAEDINFYNHNGFDWDEVSNSFKKNIEKMRLARGGSTISQQLAKNVFLTFDKSLFRKAREALLTRQLEQILSKDQILERYLNVIELGPGIYGVKQAAQHYFGKSPDDLNLLEAAYLTYLIPNPKIYSQVFDKSKLTPFARFRILDLCYKMYRYRKVDEFQYQLAKEHIDNFPWYNIPLDILTEEETLQKTPDDHELLEPRLDLPERDSQIPYVEAPPLPDDNQAETKIDQDPVIAPSDESPPDSNSDDQPFESPSDEEEPAGTTASKLSAEDENSSGKISNDRFDNYNDQNFGE